MSDETYEGWTNRETWSFNLNLRNDQDMLDMAYREVRRCIAAGYHPTAVGEHVVTWFHDWLFDVIEDGWTTAADAYRILLEVGSWWRIDNAEIGEHLVNDVLELDGMRPGSDFERAACPACGDPDCSFPQACQSAIDIAPERAYPHHDHDEVAT